MFSSLASFGWLVTNVNVETTNPQFSRVEKGFWWYNTVESSKLEPTVSCAWETQTAVFLIQAGIKPS